MTMTTCKECGKEINTQADACPNCGYSFKKQIKQVSEHQWEFVAFEMYE